MLKLGVQPAGVILSARVKCVLVLESQVDFAVGDRKRGSATSHEVS